MKKVFALVILLQVACGGNGGSMTEANPPSGPGAPATTASVQMRGADDGYGATSYSFFPATASVRRGGTVTWTNNSGAAHNVVFAGTPGAPQDIPAFSSGSQSRAFATAGSYAYSCTLHPGMAGTVSVAN
jgi:plastocyanin